MCFDQILPLRVICVVGCVCLAIGCGSNSDYYPVSGKVVTEDGNPCDGALVVFHPQDLDRVNDPKPVGRCDAKGDFQLTTHVKGDGARPGKYGVTIVWIGDSPESNASAFFGESGGGKDRLGGRYGQPQAPEFSATIVAEDRNTFEFIVR